MTFDHLLNPTVLLTWAAMSVSLFDTVLLLWLGLTVLLNAERRTWGIWVAGLGLLSGAVFFISHSAMLGQGLTYVSWGMDFWWHAGWVPVLASPFAWYVVMLWYAGYWDDPHSALRRRQRPWLIIVSLLAFGMSAFLTFANPLPSYWQLAQRNLSTPYSYNGVPMLMIAFPVYMVLCIVLSMDALRKPGPTGRLMGEVARERARPWLVATAGVLLLVSVLVTWAMVWIVLHVRETPFYNLPANVPPETLLNTIALFDLLIAALIGVSIVLLGQAVVAYEIFTGKALPRRSLLLQWWSAVVLAGGFSTLIGYSLTVATHPIYSLVLATILMVVFYAVFSWRSYVERERYMDLLRPFVTGRSLYGDLLDQSGAAATSQQLEIAGPFRVLCGEVLRAKVAYLAALGPLSPLVGPPLVYRASEQKDGKSQVEGHAQLPLADLTPQFTSPQVMWVPVDPQRFDGTSLAVPLWSERGLIGVMLLGEKRDGGLYTQEEIEIARASGERMVDTQASAEMARRLMSLQRRRLAESQVLDRQARRVLHDDVLPLLHTAMIALSSRKARVPAMGDDNPAAVLENQDSGPINGYSAEQDALAQLGDAHRRISDLLRDMPSGAAPQVARLGLLGALRKAVDEEFAGAFNNVTWQVEPEAEQQAGEVAPLAAEVLYYAAREAVRNAARYGRGGDPARPLHLKVATRTKGGLELAVEDDGVGMAASVRESGGSGQGLALHSTMMAVVGGSLATESVVGKYTRVTLSLPEV
ncbi:MAG TPA: ATP-binding protein [Chloroflexia bacterium]|jgi:signal transduction histidine kinase